MSCMTRETGLWSVNSWSPKRASNTGFVIRCCESIDAAASLVMESLRLLRSAATNSSKRAPTGPSGPSIRARIRSSWRRAMSVTESAHFSQ